MLGGLAAEQRAAGRHAGVGDALDDGGDAFGHDMAAGDVVGEEEGLGAAHHEVVDEHAHEVPADGVVDVERLGQRHLGAHAVGARGEQRMTVPGQGGGVEQAGEAPDAAEDLGAPGARDMAPHELDGLVAGMDVDARAGVGGLAHDSSSSLSNSASP